MVESKGETKIDAKGVEDGEAESEYVHDLLLLKPQIELTMSDLRITKEPKGRLIDIRDSLIEALEKDRMEKDEEFRALICDKAVDLTQNLAKRKSTDEEVSTHMPSFSTLVFTYSTWSCAQRSSVSSCRFSLAN